MDKFYFRKGKVTVGAPLAPALRGSGIDVKKIKDKIDLLLKDFPEGAKVEVLFDRNTLDVSLGVVPIATKILMAAGISTGPASSNEVIGSITQEQFNTILEEHFIIDERVSTNAANSILLNNCQQLGIEIK